MNELIPIDETNIVSILNSKETNIGKPFSRQIYLISASIAGTYYVDNIEALFNVITIGSNLRFIREPKNPHDELAIIVTDNKSNKLGYIPRNKNPILARLMDAGKLVYGTVKNKENQEGYLHIEMEIYMDD